MLIQKCQLHSNVFAMWKINEICSLVHDEVLKTFLFLSSAPPRNIYLGALVNCVVVGEVEILQQDGTPP